MGNGKEATWPGSEEEEHGWKAGISTLDFTGCGTVRPTSICIRDKELLCTLSGVEALNLAANLMAIAMNPDVDADSEEAISLTIRESHTGSLSATVLGKLEFQRTDEDKKRIQSLQRKKRSIKKDILEREGVEV
jgi:hypothetical protein